MLLSILLRYDVGCHLLLAKLIEKLDIQTEATSHFEKTQPLAFRFHLQNKMMRNIDDLQNTLSLTNEELAYTFSAHQFQFRDNPSHLRLESSEDGNFATSILKSTGQLAKDVTISQYIIQSGNSQSVALSRPSHMPECGQIAVSQAKSNISLNYAKGYKSIHGGFQTIIEQLVEKIQTMDNVTLRCQQKVESIEEGKKEFKVSSADGSSYTANKLIYACSEVGLKYIYLHSPDNKQMKITKLLDNVGSQKCLKMYLTYEHPWWEGYGMFQGDILTDLPNRVVTFLGEKGKCGSRATVLAAYAHSTYIDMFESLDFKCYERFSNKEGQVGEEATPSRLLVDYVDEMLKKIVGKK